MKRVLASVLLFMMSLLPTAFANDVLVYEDYYNYDTGYYDTRAVLYDTDNDWFYDYYVLGPQEEVEYTYDPIDNEYDWEVQHELFQEEQ